MTAQDKLARAFTGVLVFTVSCILPVGFGILINSPSSAMLALIGSFGAHLYGSRALRCPFGHRSLYHRLVSSGRLLTSWRAWSIDELASCPYCDRDLAQPLPEHH